MVFMLLTDDKLYFRKNCIWLLKKLIASILAISEQSGYVS